MRIQFKSRALPLSIATMGIFLMAQVCQAQQASPDPASEIRRLQNQAEALKEREAPQRAQVPREVKVPTQQRLPADDLPCFKIQEVRLTGPDVEPFLWALDELSGPDKDDSPLRRCVGVRGVAVLQKRLQNAVIAGGFVTTRIAVESQNMGDGVLSFHPVGGRIQALEVGEQAQNRVSFGAAMPAKPGDLLNLRDVEQALENLKRVPTAEANIEIAPGDKPGESMLKLDWKQDRRWRFSASLDDSGSDNTGKYQASATVSFDNPLGLSDLAYMGYSKSLGGGNGPSPKGSQAVNLHYSVPYGYWLFGLDASANDYHQTVVGAYDNYRYSGQGNNLEASVARVLWRNQQNITTAHASLSRRASANFIDDTEILVQRRVVTTAEVGLAHHFYWGEATLSGGWDYRQGISALGALAAPEEAFGEGTAKYRLSNIHLGLQAPFSLGEQQLVVSSSAKLQVNHTPLTPQDRFSIGGRYSVRGFDGTASLTGDRGLLWRNDLTWQAPWMVRSALYVGLDMGRVAGPSAAQLAGSMLMGMVLGVRGAWQGMGYDLFWGRPLSKPNEMQGAESVFGFGLNRSF